MNYYRTVSDSFSQTIECIAASVDMLADPMHLASEMICGTMLDNGKLLVCSIGVDTAVASLLSSQLGSRFEQDRPGLPVINLAADATTLTAMAEYNPDEVFARQVTALGQAGDLLLLIVSATPHPALFAALDAAAEAGLAAIMLGGDEAATLSERLLPGDVELRITASRRPRTLELQVMVVNGLCELIDQSLFGVTQED